MMSFAAAATAFLVTAVVGKFLIPVLRAMKAGQSIKEIGPNWHMTKQGTPTMGGIMFMVGITVAVLIFCWKDLMSGDYSALIVLGLALVYGGIGFIDDFAKVRKHENTGLTAGWKLLLQLAVSVAFLALMRNFGYLSPNLYVPFANIDIPLPWAVYLVFAAFVLVGCVNSVNLTDGLDGLAGSVTLPVAIFFSLLAAWWDKGSVGAFAAALAGGILGFLIYNFYPAKVFMGDTGSLFLGGAVCGMAFAVDAPLILIPVGIIYIAETMSDIIQVTYFKLTHGKRIFRMAPLHHHLELGGWSEVRIVLTFTAITVAFSLLAAWWDKGSVGAFAAALAGGILGFLIYNFYPAKVFMGDTGSLFLGGAVCGMAFAVDAPLILIPVGIIYIAETMSDIIQVTYFKLTHGKRIFRMAPLHHHLELGGWSEVRIVLTFTAITVAFCLLAFAGVMYRYGV